MEIVDRLVAELKSRLSEVLGDRLRGLVLYGSYARGETTAESDLDVMVLLEGPIELWNDLYAMNKTIYPLRLEIDHPIQARRASRGARLHFWCFAPSGVLSQSVLRA
jgi:predicted nucleotidyltransferase